MEERRGMLHELAMRKASEKEADARLSDDPTRKFREISERAQRATVVISTLGGGVTVNSDHLQWPEVGTGTIMRGNFIAGHPTGGKYRAA